MSLSTVRGGVQVRGLEIVENVVPGTPAHYEGVWKSDIERFIALHLIAASESDND
jgi:hypothetical protein